MVDLQTVIDELNYGKIEFDCKDDDCCTTEGEVVILLKRLAELEKNKADFVEVCRCKECKKGTRTLYKYLGKDKYFCDRHKSFMLEGDFCSYGERRDT